MVILFSCIYHYTYFYQVCVLLCSLFIISVFFFKKNTILPKPWKW